MSQENAPRWLLDIRSYWAALMAEQEERRRRTGAAPHDPLATLVTDTRMAATRLAPLRPPPEEVSHASDKI